MENIITALASKLGLIGSIIVSGLALLTVNVATHALLEIFKEHQANRNLVRRSLKPVINSASGLISRITEILVTQRPATIEDIKRYKPDRIEERIAALSALSMTRHESTAYRLVHFLASANYFSSRTAETPSFTLLEHAEYYLRHKVPTALRGNLYGLTLMNTEVQEELASSVFPTDSNRNASELNVGLFCSSLRADKTKIDFFRIALDSFSVDADVLSKENGINHRNKNWQRILALAHLGIYLIDFFQNLDDNPHWEEHRLYFVCLIKQWNQGAKKRAYLYELDDLNSDNYFDTYPVQTIMRHWWSRLLFHPINLFPEIPLVSSINRPLIRWIKNYQLNMRGRRFGNRHHAKSVSSSGVAIEVNGNLYMLDAKSDLAKLHSAINNYLKTRLIH